MLCIVTYTVIVIVGISICHICNTVLLILYQTERHTKKQNTETTNLIVLIILQIIQLTITLDHSTNTRTLTTALTIHNCNVVFRKPGAGRAQLLLVLFVLFVSLLVLLLLLLLFVLVLLV